MATHCFKARIDTLTREKEGLREGHREQHAHPARQARRHVLPLLRPGHNAIGAMLGNYKWGYTDIWCNMTASGGPNGGRAAVLRLARSDVGGAGPSFQELSVATLFNLSASTVATRHLYDGGLSLPTALPSATNASAAARKCRSTAAATVKRCECRWNSALSS